MTGTRFGFIRTTLVGGVIFLLPLLLIAFILRSGFRIAEKLSKPVVALFPEMLGGRVVVADIVAVACLLAVAFAAGLIARTGTGQWIVRWVENSLLSSLPQFNFIRGIAESMGEEQKVDVVLVPTDAGFCLGFVFEPGPGPWLAVYIPGAPEWTSGAVAWAHVDTIRPAGISFAQAVFTLRKLGAGPANVAGALSTVKP